MMKRNRRYVLITPCRDEAQYLPVTIRTVAAQSVPPTLWMIVDDGSTDGTAEILSHAAAEYDFIRVIRREDRGERSVGPGVVDAFYAGLDTVDLDQFDYLCKLDGDLELPPRYFERLMEEMEREPRLGTFSGKMYVRSKSGTLYHEARGDENSVGPSKFYRVACFRDMGGFVRARGWDGIDGHVCRMRGWIAASTDQPPIRVVHLRPLGSSQHRVLNGRWQAGTGNWYIGMSLPYMLARTLYRLRDRPIILNSLAVMAGYLQAMLRRYPRYGDRLYHRYLRRYECSVLLFGKSRAIRRLNATIAARRAVQRSTRLCSSETTT